jgi:preprotein translocase subunit SecG
VLSALLAAATEPVKAAAPAAKSAPQTLTIPPEMLQNLHYQAQTPLQQHAPWLTHTLAGLFVIAALALVALLAVQTTKQEGLSGTIVGRVESNYRGRLGMDGQLARITSGIAIAFVVIATLVSLSGI